MIKKAILLLILVINFRENFGIFSFFQRKVEIHQAVKNEDRDAIEELISENAGVLEAQDEDGKTPQSRAIIVENESLVTLLLTEGAKIDAQDKDGWAPLNYAVCLESESMLTLLLSKNANIEIQTKEGCTPLGWTVDNGYESMVPFLLSKNANSEALDKFGRTPLLRAVCFGSESLVTLLLSKGVNIEAQDMDGETPLHWVVNEDNASLVTLLLSIGANIDAQDKDGWTPLHWAVNEDNASLVTLLLSKGANINGKTNKNGTPLMLAAMKGQRALCKHLLNDEKLNKNMRDSVIMGTALHIACEHNQVEVCKLLIENGFDPNERAASLSLLHRACRNNSSKMCIFLFGVQEDLNVGDKEGDTPLHYACRYEHIGMVETLLTNKKVNPNVENLVGQTPIGYALERKNEVILRLLLTYGAQVRDKDLLYAAQYGLVAQSKLLTEHVSKKVINRLRGQLAHLVRGNDELIKLFGIYQSAEPLSAKIQPNNNTIPEQTGEAVGSETFFNLGLWASGPQLLREESIQDAPQENTLDNDLLCECEDQVSEVMLSDDEL